VKQTSFVVRQLDKAKRHRVLKDGHLLGWLQHSRNDADGDLQWRDDGIVQIRTDMGSAHTFIITTEK
jgi:hypothetical protein